MIDTSTLLACIETACRFEEIRDLEEEEKHLKQFWTDFGTMPEIADLPEETAAEVLRLCGNFLVHYGRAKAIPVFQERGKDMLSRAKEMFVTLDLHDRAALAKCQLAISYCYDGRAEAADAVLAEAEARRTETDDILLRIKVNRLIALGYLDRLDECDAIIKEIDSLIENSSDRFLQAMFYGQYGFIYNGLGCTATAVEYYRKAQAITVDLQAKRVYSLFTNSLAWTLLQMGDLEAAGAQIKKAIAVALELGDIGWLVNFYDTKASIELAAQRLGAALETIDRSLRILEKTDDAISHAESLWTKTKILLNLHRREEAALAFGDLQAVAGRAAAEQLAREFVCLMLEHEQNRPAEEGREEIVELDADYFERVRLFRLPEIDEPSFFYVPAALAKGLPVEGDAVVVAEERPQSKRRNPVILEYKKGDAFFIGQVRREHFDTDLGPLAATIIYDASGEMVSETPDTVYYRGDIVAVAPASDLNEGFLNFTRIH